MNQDDIMKALEICADSCGNCEDCPLVVLPGGVPNCMNQLVREARNLILSERRTVKKAEKEPKPKPEPWTRKRVLSEAERCVCGQREQDYGGPEDSFRLIAELWEPYIRERIVSDGTDVCIEPHDVAVMMGLLKVARIASNPKHMDNWVDGCGYFACGGEIAGKEAQE